MMEVAMNSTTRGTAEMSAAMVISGTIGWFVVRSGQPVLAVVFWRCVFGAVTMIAVCAAMGLIRRDAMSGRQLALAALGGVAIVLNWLLLFAAYSHASISVATVVYNTQPFMLVGLGVLLFAERLTLSKLFWLVMAFLGMLMIVQGKPGGSGAGGDYLVGIALALGAAFFYAVAAIVAKALKGVPPHLIVLVQVLVGIVMLAPLANVSELPSGATSWALLGTLGVVHTGLVFILLYAAIQRLPTTLTGALSFIYPLVAIIVDLAAFGLQPQLAQIAGAAAILVAAAGMTLGWSLPAWLRRSDAQAGPSGT
jgi:drug/metabolite transporter (DMT)-like permease